MSTDPHALVGAYALDALEPLEAARFRAHLRQCDRCGADLAKAHGSVVRLSDVERGDQR